MSEAMLKRLYERAVIAMNLRKYKKVMNGRDLMRHADIQTTMQTYEKAEGKQ